MKDSKCNEYDKELHDLGVDFDMDDDALLEILSKTIATQEK